MRNRFPALLALWLLSAGWLYGSWRTNVAAQIQSGDFREAGDSLLGIYKDLETADKPEAGMLLAFLFHKQNDRRLERRWLNEFFVTQGEANTDFSFLGISRDGEVTAYLNGWRLRYPRLSGAWIISRKGEQSSGAPLLLELGLEAPVEVLYRFSDEQGPLRGGLLHRGLNLVSIDAGRLFDSTRTHLFSLDLKSGGVEVKEELALEVRLNSEPASSGAPRPVDLEYKLTMFVGGRQIIVSRKTGRDKNPLALDIPKVNLRANPMFKPPAPSDDPFDPSNRGASILDAIGIAYGLIKDLFKDKTPPYESPLEKKSSETYVYYRGTSGAGEDRVTAVVTLRVRGLPAKEAGEGS